MRNSECTVHIKTRRGRTWTYRRDKDGWTQTGPTGKVRPLSAEQLLSHILPPLAAGTRSHVAIEVVPDAVGKKRERTTTTSGRQQ